MVATLEREDFPIVCCGVVHDFPRGVKKQLPDNVTRAVNLSRETAQHVAGGLKLVDDFTRNWRLSQCEACDEYYDHEVQTCSHPQCGCGMRKQRGIIDALGWASKRCPIGRWDNPPPNTPCTLADITICVASFLRPECLRRFLDSARFYYPGVKIVIADQSGEHAPGGNFEYCRGAPNVTWIDVGYDAGLSKARNAAVKAVQTRLVCLLDDDHLFTDESRLESLLDVLNSDSDVSLVCGLLRAHNDIGNYGEKATGWFADFAVKNGVLHHLALTKPWETAAGGTPYRKLNRYLNCFLAAKSLLVNIPWDESHKISTEHLDHCLTLWSSQLQAAYTTKCIFGEIHSNSDEYKDLRKRGSRSTMLRKWRVKAQTGNQVMQAEPGIEDRKTVVPVACQPNIVLLTAGNTGSTMVAGLFQRLGWNLPDNDPEYNEPFAIRQAGLEWRRCGAPIDAEGLLAACPQPWVIKNPAWCEELYEWLPALAKYKPTLVYLTRDRAAVMASWENRHYDVAKLELRFEMADRHYAYWPWSKQQITFEGIYDWVASFDQKRPTQSLASQSEPSS